ncbi:serine hydrolase [Nocardia sp. XZ_19_385]|uniref:serine hydrolase domain-containing protein n=1 Tax=Nocardia sp. XZ_19_385 TaxID=2769488 RepID=UPI00188F03D5|nr:serine hydrolase domain-containing protein [Nocardia sp. XZ_19_385]
MLRLLSILAIVAGLGVVALPVSQAAPAGPLTPAVIDDYLEAALDSTGLPGLSAVVTQGDRVVHAGGYGHDSGGGPVTADTPMRIASLSKSFTSTAVMILVDEGRISLDRTVSEQLPGFTAADARAAEVTVRQLLNQTSGLTDSTVDIGRLQGATSLADYVSRLDTAALATDPGTRFKYCNVNYNLAARLVEVASGQNFGTFLAQRVFGPLGMTDSAVSAENIAPAEGYNSIFGAWVSRPELPGFLEGSGSGGVITSAADLGKWLIAQNGRGPQLLSPAALATTHTPSPVDEYAMGWAPEDSDPTLLVHSGNLFTYTAFQAIDPATGYGFAVLANSAALHDDTYDIVKGLVALSRGQTPAEIGGQRQIFELVLALIALGTLGLGVLGVLRSRRWAQRCAARSWWRITLRLLPLAIPLLLFAAYPQIISAITGGRTVTWSQLTYFAAPLSIALLVAALAGASTAVLRMVRLRSVRSAG